MANSPEQSGKTTSARLNLTIPADWIQRFAAMTERLPEKGGARALGTLAMGAFLGMPDGYVKELYFWAHELTYDEKRDVTPAEVFARLRELILNEANVKVIPMVSGTTTASGPGSKGIGHSLPSPDVKHHVDRIVDPALKGVKPKQNPQKKTGTDT